MTNASDAVRGRYPDPGISLDVFLVDDGSTDGTAELVRARFPSVRIIAGDGSLFWCGGTRRAWAEAAQEDFDAYVWLNDDTVLRPGALMALIRTARDQPAGVADDGAEPDHCAVPPVIVVGSTCDPDTGAPTYGERDAHRAMPPPTDRPRAIAWSFNGNLVFVSAAAFRILGNLSPAYVHTFGDVDYGIRAHRAGVPVWLAPGFLAECRANGSPKWQRPDVRLADRWRALRGPKGISARELRHLMRVQGTGVWWLSMARLYCTALAPRWFARGMRSR